MNKVLLLLKYGEIILKGLNRPLFEDALVRNLKRCAGNENIKIWKAQATVYVEPKDDSVDMDGLAVKLSKVFGIVSVAVAQTVPKELDKIGALAARMIKSEPGKTFKVEAKRADKRFPYKSPEICMEVGGAILDENPHLTVDVHNSDILVMVEVRDFAAYIYTSKIPGVGGMPVGTNGRATLLLSGGNRQPRLPVTWWQSAVWSLTRFTFTAIRIQASAQSRKYLIWHSFWQATAAELTFISFLLPKSSLQ